MRTPIAYALGYPNRIESGVASLNLLQIAKLEFEAPDNKRFPCLQLAYDALKLGGTAPTILNAINEIAVPAFLNKQIQFMDIPALITKALEFIPVSPVSSLQQLIEVDAEARLFALSNLANVAAKQVLTA